MNDAFGRPQSVIVFGGTSDIAGALVDDLVATGCRRVVLAGRNTDALAKAAGRARVVGAKAVGTVTFDARDVTSVESTVARCFAAVDDAVDLVVLAVGLLDDSPGSALDPALVSDLITTNFTWPAMAMAAAGRRLRDQGCGRIIVLSSVAAVRARPSTFLYGAAKGGLDDYASGLSETLRGTGVVVQVVRPGFVHTKMTAGLAPAPFAIGPKDVAAAVVRGMEGNEAVIWVPGFLRWLYLVLRHLPGEVWRRMPG
jgi:decaprenylphospho-beta-D-erythro-pentofuranosid-2-ulose 2-reductase